MRFGPIGVALALVCTLQAGCEDDSGDGTGDEPASACAGRGGSFGPLRAGDMEVLPGSPETVVVSTRRPSVSPDFGGVYVYDNGLERPVHTPDHTGARMIVVASPTIVYGFNNSSTEFGFRRLLVHADGITNDWVVSDLFTGFATDILFAAGRVYSTNGKIVDPVPPVALGSMAVSGPVAVAPEVGEVFYATSSTNIAVYDTSTFLFLRNIGVSGVTGSPRKLVRWGGGGLALLTSARLAILSDVVGP